MVCYDRQLLMPGETVLLSRTAGVIVSKGKLVSCVQLEMGYAIAYQTCMRIGPKWLRKIPIDSAGTLHGRSASEGHCLRVRTLDR